MHDKFCVLQLPTCFRQGLPVLPPWVRVTTSMSRPCHSATLLAWPLTGWPRLATGSARSRDTSPQAPTEPPTNPPMAQAHRHTTIRWEELWPSKQIVLFEKWCFFLQNIVFAKDYIEQRLLLSGKCIARHMPRCLFEMKDMREVRPHNNPTNAFGTDKVEYYRYWQSLRFRIHHQRMNLLFLSAIKGISISWNNFCGHMRNYFGSHWMGFEWQGRNVLYSQTMQFIFRGFLMWAAM